MPIESGSHQRWCGIQDRTFLYSIHTISGVIRLTCRSVILGPALTRAV